MTGFLVVLQDTHADDSYKFFWTLKAAITAARHYVAESMIYYRLEHEELDRYDCDGKQGWWFSEGSPCGSFRVTVREISVPDLTS